jgi:hypothetical protein
VLITSILEQALKAGMYFWRAAGWPLTGFLGGGQGRCKLFAGRSGWLGHLDLRPLEPFF